MMIFNGVCNTLSLQAARLQITGRMRLVRGALRARARMATILASTKFAPFMAHFAHARVWQREDVVSGGKQWCKEPRYSPA